MLKYLYIFCLIKQIFHLTHDFESFKNIVHDYYDVNSFLTYFCETILTILLLFTFTNALVKNTTERGVEYSKFSQIDGGFKLFP